MNKVVYNINNKSVVSSTKSQLMTVYEAINGEAVSVIDDDGMILENTKNSKFSHASSVPYLSKGDKVIIQEISEHLIITDKIRNEDENPTAGFEINKDGSLSINSDVSIVLKTINAKITISENGKIMTDGKEIFSLSKGLNRIQGTSIELN